MSEWSAPGVRISSLAIILFGYAEGCPKRNLSFRKGVDPDSFGELEWLVSHFGSWIV